MDQHLRILERNPQWKGSILLRGPQLNEVRICSICPLPVVCCNALRKLQEKVVALLSEKGFPNCFL